MRRGSGQPGFETVVPVAPVGHTAILPWILGNIGQHQCQIRDFISHNDMTMDNSARPGQGWPEGEGNTCGKLSFQLPWRWWLSRDRQARHWPCLAVHLRRCSAAVSLALAGHWSTSTRPLRLSAPRARSRSPGTRPVRGALLVPRVLPVNEVPLVRRGPLVRKEPQVRKGLLVRGGPPARKDQQASRDQPARRDQPVRQERQSRRRPSST
jgi:hypothetical protein